MWSLATRTGTNNSTDWSFSSCLERQTLDHWWLLWQNQGTAQIYRVSIFWQKWAFCRSSHRCSRPLHYSSQQPRNHFDWWVQFSCSERCQWSHFKSYLHLQYSIQNLETNPGFEGWKTRSRLCCIQIWFHQSGGCCWWIQFEIFSSHVRWIFEDG